MNLLRNRIPHVLLEEDELANFCPYAKHRGVYEHYLPLSKKWYSSLRGPFIGEKIYRLLMVHDEFYYLKVKDYEEEYIFLYRQAEEAGPTSYSRILIRGQEVSTPSGRLDSICDMHEIETIRAARIGELTEWIKTSERMVKG